MFIFCRISENLESLIDAQTCILGHVGGVLRLNTFFPMSILKAHAIPTQILSSFILSCRQGLYLLAKQISQPCPFRKTLVNASYMLAGQANRITWEVSK